MWRSTQVGESQRNELAANTLLFSADKVENGRQNKLAVRKTLQILV